MSARVASPSKRRSIPFGNTVRFRVEFEVNEALTSPTSVQFYLRKDGGAAVAKTPVEDSAGKLHVDVDFDTATSEAGLYFYTWQGFGTAEGKAEGSIFISREWPEEITATYG